MRYPDPELLAQRVILQHTPAGKPYAAYRHNELNPKTVWGKPIPHCIADYLHGGEAPVLVFDNYIAPLNVYLCALEATRHLPISTLHRQIHFVAAPTERVWTLLDGNTLRGEEHQEAMKSVQRSVVLRTYQKLKDEMVNDPMDAIVIELANRMCRSRTLVRKILADANIHLPTQPKANKQLEGKPHRFSNAYTFKSNFALLTAVVQQCRSSVIQRRHKTGSEEPCSFSLADLHDQTALGGYPLRCPVTGIDLRWDEDMSWFSPRIGRYDPSEYFLSGNVLLMSKLGKRITEGLSVRSLEAVLQLHPYVSTAFSAWAAEHPVPSTAGTNLIRSMPRKPLPPLPTIEEQREKEQAYFKRLDSQLTPARPVSTDPAPAYNYYTPEDLKRDQEQEQTPTQSTPPQPTQPMRHLSVKEILGGDW